MEPQSDIRALKEVLRDLMLNELVPLVVRALASSDRRPSDQRSLSQEEAALLSRREAARTLAVSTQTIAAMIRDGSLDHVRVRRRVLIPQRSLQAYMEKQLEVHGSSAKEGSAGR